MGTTDMSLLSLRRLLIQSENATPDFLTVSRKPQYKKAFQSDAYRLLVHRIL